MMCRWCDLAIIVPLHSRSNQPGENPCTRRAIDTLLTFWYRIYGVLGVNWLWHTAAAIVVEQKEVTMRAQPFTAPVEYAGTSVRVDFIRRTYQHLAWAVLGFIVVEALLLQWSGAQVLVRTMTGGYSWFIVLAAFMGVSWLAEKWARSEASPQMQYAGLALFVVAEAIIFLPLLYIAAYFSSPNVIPTAGIVTALLFGGLTYIAFTTRRDFSFLGSILSLGGFVALGVIVASMLFGFSLGVVFAGLMVAYAGGAILYNTSNIMHQYRPDQHVAAALALFASVALMFWYVLQIVMSLSDDD